MKLSSPMGSKKQIESLPSWKHWRGWVGLVTEGPCLPKMPPTLEGFFWSSLPGKSHREWCVFGVSEVRETKEKCQKEGIVPADCIVVFSSVSIYSDAVVRAVVTMWSLTKRFFLCSQ